MKRIAGIGFAGVIALLLWTPRVYAAGCVAANPGCVQEVGSSTAYGPAASACVQTTTSNALTIAAGDSIEIGVEIESAGGRHAYDNIGVGQQKRYLQLDGGCVESARRVQSIPRGGTADLSAKAVRLVVPQP